MQIEDYTGVQEWQWLSHEDVSNLGTISLQTHVPEFMVLCHLQVTRHATSITSSWKVYVTLHLKAWTPQIKLLWNAVTTSCDRIWSWGGRQGLFYSQEIRVAKEINKFKPVAFASASISPVFPTPGLPSSKIDFFNCMALNTLKALDNVVLASNANVGAIAPGW